MAFVRFSPDSDIYMFSSRRADYECCGCRLTDKGVWCGDELDEAITHIEEHKAAGHKVPDWLIPWLKDTEEGEA